MASEKQLTKWYNEAAKISSNPEYIQAYAEYRQKAKRADQQLVRLEALSHEKHFEGVLEFAYKGAIRDIGSWGGNRRFNTAPPTKLTELEAKISDIDKFLSKTTSSKSKIVKFYKQRADTFNKGRIVDGREVGGFGKEFGVELTWQEIANYYENEKQRINDVKLASKTEVRAISVVKKLNDLETGLEDDDKIFSNYKENKEELKQLKRKKNLTKRDKERIKKLINDIDEANEKIVQVTGKDKILAHEIKRLLDQGLGYDKLLGGN